MVENRIDPDMVPVAIVGAKGNGTEGAWPFGSPPYAGVIGGSKMLFFDPVINFHQIVGRTVGTANRLFRT